MNAASAHSSSHSRQGFWAKRPAVRLSRTTDTSVLQHTTQVEVLVSMHCGQNSTSFAVDQMALAAAVHDSTQCKMYCTTHQADAVQKGLTLCCANRVLSDLADTSLSG